jgi:hypothetical protein
MALVDVMSTTKEDAFDLYSVGTVLNAWTDDLGKTYRSCQEHESLSLRDFLSTGHHFLVVSFITTLKSNVCTLTTWDTAINTCMYCLTCTNHYCTSDRRFLNWNASITVHKRRTVGFPQRKALPRATAYLTVTVFT